MKRISILASMVVACVGTAFNALAQMPVPPPAPEAQLRSADELDQLLGYIALYPDPLIAELLPAATLPPQIVLADRYVNGGGDPNGIDQQGWDPSIAALARYPTVLKWMDDNLAWTTAVGQAFLYQQQDVMDSIQRLRAQAQALGNLQSSPQENVVMDNGDIDILPADPQMIYVPVYQPNLVYYQRPYGAPFISFGIGWALGAWLDRDFDWHAHHLLVWPHGQPRPADWWTRRPSERPHFEGKATVWQSRNPRDTVSRAGDRGWGSTPPRSTVTVIGAQSRPIERRAPSNPVERTPVQTEPRREPAAPVQRTPVQRPAPAPVQHQAEAPRARPASGALIGVQSSHETQQFSSRGQASRQATVSHPAAAPSHSAPPARSEPPRPSPAPGKR